MTPETSTAAEAPHVIPPTGCCPRFDPTAWDRKEVVFENKPFVKEHVRSVFHVPLNIGHKIVEARNLIEAAHATPEHPLMLVDDSSPWGEDLYLEVTGPVPGATVVTLSGRFLTKVFEGPYRDMPHWAASMRGYVEGRGRKLSKLWFAYTTCPACAKAYGENYVVLLAQVEG